MIDWKLTYDEIPFYPYCRSLFEGEKLTIYKPNTLPSISDISGLIKLILLFFRKEQTVLFIPDRIELLKLSREKFDSNTIIFFRKELNTGNVFFIEVIRYFFRLYASIFKNNYFDLTNKDFISRSHDFIGDMLFNKYFLRPILRNHKIYFTNCVVPLSEKYQNLYDSCEVQHGVIYKGHHDYTNIPNDIKIGPILAWNKHFVDILTKDCNYPGVVLDAKFDFFENFYEKNSNACLILSGVNDKISNDIISKLNSKFNILRRHPRDRYDYKSFVGELDDSAKLMRYSKVYTADSTLIFTLKLHNCFFYYLHDNSKPISLEKINLKNKYGVEHEKDYDFF